MQRKSDYQILPCALDEGRGYNLRLFLDGVEVDRKIFNADPDATSHDGTDWFNSFNEAGRALCLYEAHSDQPVEPMRCICVAELIALLRKPDRNGIPAGKFLSKGTVMLAPSSLSTHRF
jgi:hypothetical protein